MPRNRLLYKIGTNVLIWGEDMFNHHTKSKGDFAIFKSQMDLYEKGYTILLPLTEHAPFDLVAYKENAFIRVQVKYRHLNDKGVIYVKFSNSYSTKKGVQIKSS